MISLKELQYVGSKANCVPFPGTDYAQYAISALEKAVAIYQKKYENKKYSLILSDGTEFEYEIHGNNLAHLLGVDYKNLILNMKNYLESVLGIDSGETTTSYAVLQRIIECGDDIIKHDQKNYDKFLNYYKLMIKTTCFEKFADFKNFNFGCINFDKDTYAKASGRDFLPASRIFLFSSSDEANIPYCMMGFKDSNIPGIMVPETFMAPTNFNEFLVNQVLLLPIQLLVNDNQVLSKNVATAHEKIRLLNLYKSLISQYGINCYIEIFHDYQTLLNSLVVAEKAKELSIF